MTRRNPVDKAIAKAGTQKVLAEKIGVSRQTIGYWLKVGEFPVHQIKLVAKATGLPVSELLSKQQKVLAEA